MVDMPPETLVWHSQLSRMASEQCTNHDRVRGKINAGFQAAAHCIILPRCLTLMVCCTASLLDTLSHNAFCLDQSLLNV
jgi:hypothetical protein